MPRDAVSRTANVGTVGINGLTNIFGHYSGTSIDTGRKPTQAPIIKTTISGTIRQIRIKCIVVLSNQALANKINCLPSDAALFLASFIPNSFPLTDIIAGNVREKFA